MRRDADDRPRKSDMMRWLMHLQGGDPNVPRSAERRRYVLVDDLPRNIEDVEAAGFSAVRVPDRRYSEGAADHDRCGGVSAMLDE
jgi:hypothetical protein